MFDLIVFEIDFSTNDQYYTPKYKTIEKKTHVRCEGARQIV